MIRVLVVDDSAFMRKAISSMLSEDSDIQVIATARDGQDGVEKCQKLEPDVVTMDIEMPRLDGLSALKKIMDICPTPVIMCSSLTTDGSHETLRAMSDGAADFIAKDMSRQGLDIANIRDDLVSKVKAVARSVRFKHLRAKQRTLTKPVDGNTAPAKPTRKELRGGPQDAMPTFQSRAFDVVLIGSSTGGPPALEKVLTALPADLNVPIVIAQHMPLLFTKSLANRLSDMCAITVLHAEDGMPLLPGTALLSPGGSHGRIKRRINGAYQMCVSGEPASALYKPSVNELFYSGAKYAGSRVLAIVLTGMGDDGKIGATAIKQAGGQIIAQNEASCVVYGMPRAVTEADIVTARLEPTRIGETLRQLVTAPTPMADPDQRMAG